MFGRAESFPMHSANKLPILNTMELVYSCKIYKLFKTTFIRDFLHNFVKTHKTISSRYDKQI